MRDDAHRPYARHRHIVEVEGPGGHAEWIDAEGGAFDPECVTSTADELLECAIERNVAKRRASRALNFGVDCGSHAEQRRELRDGGRNWRPGGNLEESNARRWRWRHRRLAGGQTRHRRWGCRSDIRSGRPFDLHRALQRTAGPR